MMDIVNFQNIAEFGQPDWQQKMKELGDIMAEQGLRQTVFVHGTFVGDDPLGLFGAMNSLGLAAEITDFFEQSSKKLNDFSSGELGNFLEDYNSAYAAAIQNHIQCRLFNWNSMNNHIGRLCAVPELAHDLAKHLDDCSADDRILLIGHSHAGQLFALLTVFLEQSQKAKQLADILNGTDNYNPAEFEADLQTLSKVFIDIVTLGTPVRYRWGNYSKYRLLNLVNHRSNSSLSGVPTTRDGDYVQQWGTAGRDLSPLGSESLKQKNQQLDDILDKGVSDTHSNLSFVADLISNTAKSTRRQALTVNDEHAGASLFIDYKDNGLDPVKTLFGHGCYTQKERMLFNTNLIVKNLYGG